MQPHYLTWDLIQMAYFSIHKPQPIKKLTHKVIW